MKKLFFNNNNYLEKNNFNLSLKKELRKMFHQYFKENVTVPTKFDIFDKEISDLIIKILDEQDAEKHNRKKNLKLLKTTTVHNWKSKRFIK